MAAVYFDTACPCASRATGCKSVTGTRFVRDILSGDVRALPLALALEKIQNGQVSQKRIGLVR